MGLSAISGLALSAVHVICSPRIKYIVLFTKNILTLLAIVERVIGYITF